MEDTRKLFFATLHAALDRKPGALSTDRMFRRDTWNSAIDEDDQDVVPKNQAAWMASFMEQATLLSIETAVVDTPDGVAKAVADIATRTPTEWSAVKTVVCCNHPLIRSTAIRQALDAIHIPMFFPEQGATPPIDRRQDALYNGRNGADAGSAQEFRQQCAQATLGIFTADAAIAESATLVLRTSPHCPRIVSLLPSASIAIVPFGCIFDTFSRLAAHLALHPAPDGMTFITGPSKTADIEAVMVPGAHGPRNLHVLFVTTHCLPLFFRAP